MQVALVGIEVGQGVPGSRRLDLEGQDLRNLKDGVERIGAAVEALSIGLVADGEDRLAAAGQPEGVAAPIRGQAVEPGRRRARGGRLRGGGLGVGLGRRGQPAAQADRQALGHAVRIARQRGLLLELIDPQADLIEAVEQHVDEARIRSELLGPHGPQQVLGGVDQPGQGRRIEQPGRPLSVWTARKTSLIAVLRPGSSRASAGSGGGS